MSSINPNNINGSYPIAGQDNDSQGFRDNFTNIKNNLTFAKNEIADLQLKSILTEPLSDGSFSNELNYAQIKGAQLIRTVETIKDIGPQTSSTIISFADGHYQKVTTTAGTALTISAFTNWPTSGLYAKLRLEIVISQASTDTITLPAAVSVGLTNIQGWNGSYIKFPAAGSYVFEFTTYNAGTTITIEDLTRNCDNITGDFTITGNLTLGGATIATGYQYSAATSDFDQTVGASVSRVIYNPASTLAKGTLTLPAGNVEAKVVTVSSTQTITAFKVNPSVGTTLVPSANVTLSAGTSVSYFYHASETKWYKIG
jgi:hypothetical protein